MCSLEISKTWIFFENRGKKNVEKKNFSSRQGFLDKRKEGQGERSYRKKGKKVKACRRFQGKSEYIGRAIARPHVKLDSESYAPPNFPPSLEWCDVTRGAARAGELLAVFELLEYPSTTDYGFPTLPDPKELAQTPITVQDHGPILPVPVGIRPTLSNYRWASPTLPDLSNFLVISTKVRFIAYSGTLFVAGSKCYFGV